MGWVFANLLLVWMAWRIGRRVAPQGGPWTRVLAVGVVGCGLVTLAMLAAGISGMLGFWPVLAGVIALSMLTVPFARRRPPVLDLPPVKDPWVPPVAVALGASLAVWLGRVAWRGTSFSFDDVVYHAAIPAFWMQEGGFAFAPFSYQSYYAFNSELIALWFMLPTGGVEHAGLATACFAVLSLLAVQSIGETLEIPPAASLLAMAVVLTPPSVSDFANTFNATDLALTAYVLASVAFAILPGSKRAAAFSGVAAGLAVGTKVSAAPVIALVVLWWAWRRRVSWVAVLLATLALFGSYWYLRNLIATGNPLFPATVGPFSGPLEPEAAHETSLLRFIEERGHTLAFWNVLAAKRLNWPVPLGVLAIGGWAAWVGRRDKRAWLLAAIALVFVALHPFQPFSGTNNRPDSGLHGLVRYLALPFVIGITGTASLASSYLRTRGVVGLLGLAWAVALWSAASDGYARTDWVFWVFGGGFALLMAFVVGRSHTGWVPATAVVTLLLCGWRGEAKRTHSADAQLGFHKGAVGHVEGMAYLRSLPAGTRVGFLGDLPPSHSWNLPLMGDRFQFERVPLDPYGRQMFGPLHTRWRDEPASWWWQFESAPPTGLPVLKHVTESDADVLVLSRCQKRHGGRYSIVRRALTATYPGARLYSSRCMEVWELDAIRGSTLRDAPRRSEESR